MAAHPTNEAARDIALQKIGRNMVNFQKMEAMLKFVLAFCDISGPLTAVGPQIAGRIASFPRMSMGRLVEQGSAGLYIAPRSTELTSTNEITASVSFRLEGGENSAQVWRAAMMEVVKERNRLVHQMLADFDPRSTESCQDLAAVLDAQRERIVPAYEHLESLVLAIRDSHRELAQQLDAILASESAVGANYGA